MTLTNTFTRFAPYALAAGFLFFGAQKFGAENIVFETIAERSGISLFEPWVRIFTGIAELSIAALLLLPRTRLLGAVGGLGIVGGAIAFHLSPWLGIVVPGIGIGLFVTALALFSLNALYLAARLQEYRAEHRPALAVEGLQPAR